jgi:glutamine synthetase
MSSALGADVIRMLADKDITTIRVEGTNHDGALMGKNLSPRKFYSGLKSGFPMADLLFGSDLNNVPQFGYSYPDWRGNLPDVFLKPDLSTLLEWSPGRASVVGDFWLESGQPVPVCPRNLLRRMVEHLSSLGYAATTAVEIEATLFEESIHDVRRKVCQNLTPLGGSKGFAYHLAKSKDWDDYMVAVTRRLEYLGIEWDAWNDEAASGQIELNIVLGDPLSVCDNWARTRQVMREVAFELGHSVSFMAKPTSEFGQASHLNVSLSRDDQNAFYAADGPSDTMLHAVGGLMATMEGMTSLALPQITSYRRLVDFSGPPTTVTWGIGNKTAAIKAVCGHPSYARLEYRVPGADANLYLVTAGVLGSIIAGLERNIEPPEQVTDMAWFMPADVKRIPTTITKAAEALEQDQLLAEMLGQEFIDYWLGTRRWEWMQFHTTGGDPDAELSAWELERYFELP